MSDLLGTGSYTGDKNTILYDFRFDGDQGLLKSQTLGYTNESKIGGINLTYSQSRKSVNSILELDSENISASYASSKFLKYSSIGFSTQIDSIMGYSSLIQWIIIIFMFFKGYFLNICSYFFIYCSFLLSI